MLVTVDILQTQVTDILSVLWRVLEPMLYAFIGADVDVRVLDIPTVTWGMAVIMGALLVRCNLLSNVDI